MTRINHSKQQLLDECLKRGLPVSTDDNIEQLKLYLNLADHIDNEEDETDREILNEIEVKKKKRSFLSRLFTL